MWLHAALKSTELVLYKTLLDELCFNGLIMKVTAEPALLCRGCGGLKLESPRPYSQLDTDDVQTAIAGLRNMYPDAPILLAGYSLGAMLVAKYLAEARYNSAASGGDLAHAPSAICHAMGSMCSQLPV